MKGEDKMIKQCKYCREGHNTGDAMYYTTVGLYNEYFCDSDCASKVISLEEYELHEIELDKSDF